MTVEIKGFQSGDTINYIRVEGEKIIVRMWGSRAGHWLEMEFDHEQAGAFGFLLQGVAAKVHQQIEEAAEASLEENPLGPVAQ